MLPDLARAKDVEIFNAIEDHLRDHATTIIHSIEIAARLGPTATATMHQRADVLHAAAEMVVELRRLSLAEFRSSGRPPQIAVALARAARSSLITRATSRTTEEKPVEASSDA